MAFGCVVRGAPKDRILTSSLKLVLLYLEAIRLGSRPYALSNIIDKLS